MREDEKKPRAAERRGLGDTYTQCQIGGYFTVGNFFVNKNRSECVEFCWSAACSAAIPDYSLEMRTQGVARLSPMVFGTFSPVSSSFSPLDSSPNRAAR